jgi:hypothetical protein
MKVAATERISVKLFKRPDSDMPSASELLARSAAVRISLSFLLLSVRNSAALK